MKVCWWPAIKSLYNFYVSNLSTLHTWYFFILSESIKEKYSRALTNAGDKDCRLKEPSINDEFL
jgi:hypothetical protein